MRPCIAGVLHGGHTELGESERLPDGFQLDTGLNDHVDERIDHIHNPPLLLGFAQFAQGLHDQPPQAA